MKAEQVLPQPSVCVLAPDSWALPPAGGSVLLLRSLTGATTCSSIQLWVTVDCRLGRKLVIQLMILNELTQLCDVFLWWCDEGEFGSTQRMSSGCWGICEDKQAEQTEESPSWRLKASLQTALWSEPEKVRPPWTFQFLGRYTWDTFLISAGSCAVNNSMWLSAERDADLVEVNKRQVAFLDFSEEL